MVNFKDNLGNTVWLTHGLPDIHAIVVPPEQIVGQTCAVIFIGGQSMVLRDTANDLLSQIKAANADPDAPPAS